MAERGSKTAGNELSVRIPTKPPTYSDMKSPRCSKVKPPRDSDLKPPTCEAIPSGQRG